MNCWCLGVWRQSFRSARLVPLGRSRLPPILPSGRTTSLLRRMLVAQHGQCFVPLDGVREVLGENICCHSFGMAIGHLEELLSEAAVEPRDIDTVR